ncbi:MAG: hypothetical protein P8049_10755 [Gemmatimonadota bacterium]
MARAHGLFGALIVMKNGLNQEIEAEGGLLKTGLYAPNVGVADLAGRINQGRQLQEPWLREMYPTNPAIRNAVDQMLPELESLDYSVDYLVSANADDSPKLHLKANFFITGQLWDLLMRKPEWGPVITEYLQYLARQTGPPETRPVGREVPEGLVTAFQDLARSLEAEMSEEQMQRSAAFFTVGSTNMDYRSMVMDGEVQITMQGWSALAGLVDFAFLVGLCEWVDTLEELDALLPPPGGLTRTMANFMKLAL